MISGNLTLSLDLRRLGFIKVLVWLTRPSTYIYNEHLLTKYKDTVKAYRDQFGWKVDPVSGETASGMGIGDEKLPATQDAIALNHLVLARSLAFLKAEVNTWWTNGLILASQYIDGKGQPYFYDHARLEEMLKRKGLVAVLGSREKFVFCHALLFSDIDGERPLLGLIGDGISKGEIVEKYFGETANWYESKAKLEMNLYKRNSYLSDRKRFASKGDRKDASEDIHKESQVTPRLEFLRDLDIIENRGTKYYLTQRGKILGDALSAEKGIPELLGEKRNNLSVLLASLYGSGLDQASFDNFHTEFQKISGFYGACGIVLMSYDHVFESMVASLLGSNFSLPFAMFDDYLKKLEEVKRIYVSRAVPDRRYIRLLTSTPS